MSVVPLLASPEVSRRRSRRPVYAQGREQEIVVLFADLRGFTRFAEARLPYDVVFVLNRYFEEMGNAVEATGGYVDKVVGDGVMALFGLDTPAAQACAQALTAARLMLARLDELSRTLAAELDAPLRMGIGIHTGSAIVGEMGYGKARSLTALGDTVNLASRLQLLTKTYECELIVSEDVLRRAGVNLENGVRREIEIRGREAMIAIYTAATTRRDLKEALGRLPTSGRLVRGSRTGFLTGPAMRSARSEVQNGA